jgi:adenylate kinase family enzyme
MKKPRRIFITGNAGSGKSTLAKKLGKILDTEVFGLDKIVWKPNWEKTEQPQRAELEESITSSPNWIVEGVSLFIQEKAETVVFLDFSRRTSYLRYIKRTLRHLFSQRPELPPECPEYKIIPQTIKIIWNFPGKVRPKILSLKEKKTNEQTFVHIKSKKQLAEFVKSFREDRF